MTELTKHTDGFAGAERWTLSRLDLCDRGRPRKLRPADRRLERLVGDAGWQRLPAAVRRRFGKLGRAGETTVYRGYIESCELSPAGWLIANLARVVGAPLPLDAGRFQPGDVPATVVVEALAGGAGTFWTRIYGRLGRFPQTITSAKRFTAGGALEEHLGHGLVMRLAVVEEAGSLVFRSTGYHLQIGRLRIGLPAVLSPGVCEIIHRAEPNAADRLAEHAFTFTLTLRHAALGPLVRQVARFTDVHAAGTVPA
jgi:Domain of unknown function (DUF4166)